ncbi:BURP domain protein RD22 isoform X2 [Rosa chinensis]|uniref:BURP domain protein RD22 isoform X2 n=1 Tax=Rosa chinensis TaxID=74649 RepID=UPI000D090400|nr:BURP domain protein RD22 isoform X2 [Rosa chinensis]
MDQFRLLWLFAIFYVASVVVGIGYSNKVGDGKSWMSYWNSTLPKSPLPSKAVQQLLNLAGERSYSGIGKDSVSGRGCVCFSCYGGGCTEEVKVKPGLTTYFQEKDLQHLGKTVTLQFLKPTDNNATLLPRKVVKSIPFSSNKLPEILIYFGVKPMSAVAEIMKSTIEECEAPAIKGEDKYCATSLESLIDFTVSKLGKYIQVYATEAENNNENKQEYGIEITGVQSIGDSSVVCHKESYVYGVFYCHKFNNTRAYMVPLVGADGVAKVKALVVCHTDTTSWNPKHLAFQVLKIKPGNTIAVCHFLATAGLLWVPM